MSPVTTSAEVQNPIFQAGDTVRVKNKRNEPEPKATVILHDSNRLLVLVEVFTADRGTARWWIPDYMCSLIKSAEPSHNEPASA